MSADSGKPNIIGGNWTKYCTVAKSVDRGRPIWTSVVVRARARASLALCGRFNQFRSPYSWITMRRALRKRRVFDFVPSYLNCLIIALVRSERRPTKNMCRWLAHCFGAVGSCRSRARPTPCCTWYPISNGFQLQSCVHNVRKFLFRDQRQSSID